MGQIRKKFSEEKGDLGDKSEYTVSMGKAHKGMGLSI
jgi:hypothetical protein